MTYLDLQAAINRMTPEQQEDIVTYWDRANLQLHSGLKLINVDEVKHPDCKSLLGEEYFKGQLVLIHVNGNEE